MSEMAAPHTEPTIFFTGRYSFRSSKRAGAIVACLVVSGVSLLVGIRQLLFTGVRDPGPLGLVACAVGISALAVAAVQLRAYVRGAVDELYISDRGVKYGEEFWPWDSLTAFRIRRLPAKGPMRILIWTGEDRGAGRHLAIDDPPSSVEAERLVAELRAFLADNDLNVQCE